MHWRQRSLILRTLAAVPGGHAVYLALQNRMGSFYKPGYIAKKFRRQALIAGLAKDNGQRLAGACVVEVGTGWVPALPVGFWLCGAADVHTFDLNRYLSRKILNLTFAQFDDPDRVIDIWDGLADPGELRSRVNTIAERTADPFDFLSRLNIHYNAPGDARHTRLADNACDIHYSTNTLEHIPREDLLAIFIEARRILKPGGLAIHYVDPADHFAYVDNAITTANFLQLTESEWRRHYGNRYAYQNRMFDLDFRDLFKEASLQLIDCQFTRDEKARNALNAGLPRQPQFAERSIEELSRRGLLYVLTK